VAPDLLAGKTGTFASKGRKGKKRRERMESIVEGNVLKSFFVFYSIVHPPKIPRVIGP